MAGVTGIAGVIGVAGIAGVKGGSNAPNLLSEWNLSSILLAFTDCKNS